MILEAIMVIFEGDIYGGNSISKEYFVVQLENLPRTYLETLISPKIPNFAPAWNDQIVMKEVLP